MSVSTDLHFLKTLCPRCSPLSFASWGLFMSGIGLSPADEYLKHLGKWPFNTLAEYGEGACLLTLKCAPQTGRLNTWHPALCPWGVWLLPVLINLHQWNAPISGLCPRGCGKELAQYQNSVRTGTTVLLMFHRGSPISHLTNSWVMLHRCLCDTG